MELDCLILTNGLQFSVSIGHDDFTVNAIRKKSSLGQSWYHHTNIQCNLVMVGLHAAFYRTDYLSKTRFASI
ncbi:hypothetical protein GCK32_002717 [Trichostrongylus colubriformis]|uniref:Uncharacterized protein n=1 Tax=Trichostrongylus colubriformis TaxID=6319 RepID=A0AAN8FIF3_TRICO